MGAEAGLARDQTGIWMRFPRGEAESLRAHSRYYPAIDNGALFHGRNFRSWRLSADDALHGAGKPENWGNRPEDFAGQSKAIDLNLPGYECRGPVFRIERAQGLPDSFALTRSWTTSDLERPP